MVGKGSARSRAERRAQIRRDHAGLGICNQHIVSAGEENTRGAGECEVGCGGDSGVASRSGVTAWTFLIQIVGLRECVACSASLGSPHGSPRSASLIADDVVFGTHAARFHPLQSAPSKIRTKRVRPWAGSVTGHATEAEPLTREHLWTMVVLL
jgi:hypothetical protein